jgi:hypothetical protein
MIGVTTDVAAYNRMANAPREGVSYTFCPGWQELTHSGIPKYLDVLFSVFGTGPMPETMLVFVLSIEIEAGRIRGWCPDFDAADAVASAAALFSRGRDYLIGMGILRTVREENQR